MWYSDDVFVIKDDDIEKLKQFLHNFGLSFVEEKHGDGPRHYSCQVGNKVLELYPKRKDIAS